MLADNPVKQLQKAQNIDKRIFAHLMSLKKRNTEDEIDVIGYSAEANGYTINYYGTLEGDYELVIEAFGKMVKGRWMAYEPTTEQMTEMQGDLYGAEHFLTRSKEREDSSALQAIIDERRYGRPDTLYGRNY